MLNVDVYYDMSCSNCARSATSDWGVAPFSSKERARQWGKRMNWKTVQGMNICQPCQIEMKIRKEIEKKFGEELLATVNIDHHLNYNSWYINSGDITVDDLKKLISKIDLHSENVQIFSHNN